MAESRSRWYLSSGLLLFFLTFCASLPAQVEPSGFSLGMPNGFIGGHVGLNVPSAGSDVFTMVTRELTLDKADFRSPAFGFDIGAVFKSRYALVFSLEYSNASPESESRGFVEEDGSPIIQSTRLSQLPITATFRFYPRTIGETVGSYAWIPSRFLPYLAGGGGAVHFRFNQRGDFVDSQTLQIFPAHFRSGGFGATLHAAAGVDLGISTRFFANVEMRYSWAHADMTEGFDQFQPIDLSGLRLNGGLFFRF